MLIYVLFVLCSWLFLLLSSSLQRRRDDGMFVFTGATAITTSVGFRTFCLNCNTLQYKPFHKPPLPQSSKQKHHLKWQYHSDERPIYRKNVLNSTNIYRQSSPRIKILLQRHNIPRACTLAAERRRGPGRGPSRRNNTLPANLNNSPKHSI